MRASTASVLGAGVFRGYGRLYHQSPAEEQLSYLAAVRSDDGGQDGTGQIINTNWQNQSASVISTPFTAIFRLFDTAMIFNDNN